MGFKHACNQKDAILKALRLNGAVFFLLFLERYLSSFDRTSREIYISAHIEINKACGSRNNFLSLITTSRKTSKILNVQITSRSDRALKIKVE